MEYRRVLFRSCLVVRTTRCLAVDCNDLGTGPCERGDPLHKALLELFGIERREDVTKVIVRGRACSKGTKSLQKIQLFLSKAGDVDECLRTRQNAQQRQKQYLLKRIHHLCQLATNGQVTK